MIMFKYILLIFALSGCFPHFNLSDPLIDDRKLPPRVEKISWLDYDDEYVSKIPFNHDGCVLYYLKSEVICEQCDEMDKTFEDPEVAFLSNKFLTIKATSDMPDWEKAIKRINIKLTPSILIMKKTKFLFFHEDYAIPPKFFVYILRKILPECKKHHKLISF